MLTVGQAINVLVAMANFITDNAAKEYYQLPIRKRKKWLADLSNELIKAGKTISTLNLGRKQNG